jgi:23S rRNA pseudouridine2457 synthase
MSPKKYLYFKIYKPYGVLSQFTNSDGRQTLKDIFKFPQNVYPVGRLDFDSEGLLLLTNDKTITDYLLNPVNKHKREYLVQVEGNPAAKEIHKLRGGVIIKGRKTLPAEVEIITSPKLPDRNPPIRFRKNIPESWLKITLTEGKNRQVRRMTAAVGFPTLRLVRNKIENISLGKMNPGEVMELSEDEIYELKKNKKAAK